MTEEALRVLCAGDRFITPSALGEAFRTAHDGPVEIVEWATEWPDVPFGPVGDVREASGDPASLVQAVAGAQVLLTHLAPVTAGVFAAADALRVVGSVRGGPVNVDLAAATAAGVPVVYLPGRNLRAVTEFTVGVMIAMPRAIARASHSLRDGDWDARFFRYDFTGPELRASTIGLVGLGSIGRGVAELATALGAAVIAHDPYADTADVPLVELPELLARSDIVSLHLRLTDETRKLFGADQFAAMKRGAYFVNTARGGLVDQQALLAALESGHLAGAALDVFDPEPPKPDDPLLARPDVLATPHLAGASRQVAEESAARVAREVAEFLRTGEISNCANPGWRATLSP